MIAEYSVVRRRAGFAIDTTLWCMGVLKVCAGKGFSRDAVKSAVSDKFAIRACNRNLFYHFE